MKLKIIKVGNSRAIRLTKVILEQCNFKDEVEIEVTNKGLLISPIERRPRHGWDDQFKLAIADGEEPEKSMLGNFDNKFDEEEWTWPEMDI